MLPGLDKLEKDTILVIVFTKVMAGLVIVLTGLAMLANHWNEQAEPDVTEPDYHVDHGGGHGDDHGGGHGDDHGGDDHAEPAAH